MIQHTTKAAVFEFFHNILTGGRMANSSLTEQSSYYGWRELYLAALFESDKTKIPERIAEAQLVIDARRRKLFKAGDDTNEKQVLDNALFSLHALASCLAITPRIPSRSRAA